MGWYATWGKRAFDLVLVGFGSVVMMPLMAVVAALVRAKFGSPVVFRQVRAGRHGARFTIYKFRTMTNDRDDEGHLLPDDMRLTKFGQFLRAASLDEMPEVWNVIRGDMSLVGPRPLLLDYLSWYSPDESARHAVKPGLTGLSQVNGRNAKSWDERLAWDVEYVRTFGPRLDLRIVARTVATVLRREGISIEGHATPPRLDIERANSRRRGQV